MPESTAGYIFLSAFFILLFGAVTALLFGSKVKISIFISYSSAVMASVCGIIASAAKLLHIVAGPVDLEMSASFDFLRLSFRIDDLAAFFILLISFLLLAVSVYSFGYVRHYENKRNIGLLGALYNMFAGSMLLVVTSGQIFMFLVSWELMSLISYFLVVYENDKPEAQKAGLIYIIMTHIGTAFITAGFVLIYKYTGQTAIHLMDASLIPASVKDLVFIFLMIGFGTKAGIIPLHIWLPYAHPAAPSNISALMSGAMIKTAVYGMIRFILGTMSPGMRWWGMALLISGAASAILGIAYALMEHNIKRLLAYSSIENMGMILMGIGLSIFAASGGEPVIAALSLTAALFHTFNHSVFKGLLFLGAGSVHTAAGTKNMEKLGGLIKKMPYTAVFFLIASLSVCAIPPFNGFVSEWLTYQVMFLNIASGTPFVKMIILVCAALLAMAGALAAYCFVKAFGISFLAKPRTLHAADASESKRSMLVGMGILSAACLFLGIAPLLLIRLLDSVNLQMFGVTVLGQIRGASSLLMYPVTVFDASYSPLSLILIFIMLFSLLTLFMISVSAGKKARRYVTWDCGYVKTDSRMQYSATGFSKPARIIFRSLFRPGRELKVEESVSPYHIRSARYTVSTLSVLEKYFYAPVVKRTINFARKIRFRIQTGSIHTYLLYIFITILLMFVYYGLVS